MIKSQNSKNAQKCYNIMVTGKVLDVGFRTLIEEIARFHDLRGYAFNDLDGSVKMVCCGDDAVINEFLDEVRFRGVQKGAAIEDIEKEEITQKIFLPQRFLRLYTDELADISRKLDVGIGILKEIKGDTSALPEIKETLSSFVSEQREHNKRLEKILEKLAEK
ncbi:MAG: acylphosphatase [Candidatus Methanoperedens sp.]|nr:acylphosphatase [Candidatus Methanoperedens sp.]